MPKKTPLPHSLPPCPAGGAPHVGPTRKRRARRLLFSVSLMAFSFGLLPAPNHGQMAWLDSARAAGRPVQDVFADLTPLTDDTLSDQRGGFSAGGFDIDVGVTVTTTIDGFVEVSTSYSYTSPDGLVHLGSDVKNLASDLGQSIKAAVQETVAEAEEKKAEALATAPATPVVSLALAEVKSYDDNLSASDAPPPPPASPASTGTSNGTSNGTGNGTNIGTGHGTSHSTDNTTGNTTGNNVVAGGGTPPAATPETTPIATPAATPATTDPAASPPAVTLVVSAPAEGAETAPAAPANTAAAPPAMAEIIHRNDQGHVTILTNRLNGVSVRQTVSYNVTIENFSQIQKMARLQNDMAHLARHISLYSLRR